MTVDRITSSRITELPSQTLAGTDDWPCKSRGHGSRCTPSLFNYHLGAEHALTNCPLEHQHDAAVYYRRAPDLGTVCSTGSALQATSLSWTK